MEYPSLLIALIIAAAVLLVAAPLYIIRQYGLITKPALILSGPRMEAVRIPLFLFAQHPVFARIDLFSDVAVQTVGLSVTMVDAITLGMLGIVHRGDHRLKPRPKVHVAMYRIVDGQRHFCGNLDLTASADAPPGTITFQDGGSYEVFVTVEAETMSGSRCNPFGAVLRAQIVVPDRVIN